VVVGFQGKGNKQFEKINCSFFYRADPDTEDSCCVVLGREEHPSLFMLFSPLLSLRRCLLLGAIVMVLLSLSNAKVVHNTIHGETGLKFLTKFCFSIGKILSLFNYFLSCFVNN